MCAAAPPGARRAVLTSPGSTSGTQGLAVCCVLRKFGSRAVWAHSMQHRRVGFHSLSKACSNVRASRSPARTASVLPERSPLLPAAAAAHRRTFRRWDRSGQICWLWAIRGRMMGCHVPMIAFRLARSC